MSRPAAPHDPELPAVAGSVTLPAADWGLAGALATRWMLRLTLLLLLALVALCAVGLHIPSGE